MSDYFACLDLINFKMSSALLALSPVVATDAASGCGAGALSVTGAAVGAAPIVDVLHLFWTLFSSIITYSTDDSELKRFN